MTGMGIAIGEKEKKRVEKLRNVETLGMGERECGCEE